MSLGCQAEAYEELACQTQLTAYVVLDFCIMLANMMPAAGCRAILTSLQAMMKLSWKLSIAEVPLLYPWMHHSLASDSTQEVRPSHI